MKKCRLDNKRKDIDKWIKYLKSVNDGYYSILEKVKSRQDNRLHNK